MVKNRGWMDELLDVLVVLPANRSQAMLYSKVSNKKAKDCLDECVEYGLAKTETEDGVKTYHRTDEGSILLQMYSDMLNRVPSKMQPTISVVRKRLLSADNREGQYRLASPSSSETYSAKKQESISVIAEKKTRSKYEY